MQNLFDEVGSLDSRCYEKFGLSEDILMEHAANGMADYIRHNFAQNSRVLIACGSGNNGADGIALGRLLHGEYRVKLLYVKKPKSKMATLQAKRSQSLGVKEITKLQECDVLVDAVLGTGFRGDFDEKLQKVMRSLNALSAFKIACDIPSGLQRGGRCDKDTFQADVSLTMGALKRALYLDEAKEFVGEIRVLNLGVSREFYETKSAWKLLDMDDLSLPYRELKNSHKGSFGHLALACGSKAGASIISARSALRFGSGLVTLIGYENELVPFTIMYSHELAQNTTALACGMGLGDEFSDEELRAFLNNTLPLVADADIFSMKIILEILKRKKVVLTPHPKEFVSLLKLTNIANVSVEELQQNRFKYVELFCAEYPSSTLLLKGSNVVIGKKDKFYINPHGTSALAKAGSGDVLSGLIGALLAQGSKPLDAAINASLAHTKLVQNYQGADFSLTPDDLISGIGKL
jgi:hydroxyethylthiazole kinase-like uncharacterized protein yjeF